jgi:diguanylate cyclase (GGDEF)-like protein
VVVLGVALLSWAVGDVVLCVESLGGVTPSVPSIADIFYLGFYPLAYAALALLVRREAGSLVYTNWLDGAVAGMGAAAVVAAFAFDGILHSVGGSVASVATNLAYPVGDLLLLLMVVGGTAVLPGRMKAPWLLLATGFVMNAVGDTFNLVHAASSVSQVGTLFDSIAWPTSLLLLSMAVWVPSRTTSGAGRGHLPGFLAPGIAAGSALAILVYGAVRPLGPISLGLATTTLVIVGIRMRFSLWTLRILTLAKHGEAMTDALTGLGNRRHLFDSLQTFLADSEDALLSQPNLAFLYVDLDHFKAVNDSFGHAAGDELLRNVGTRLRGLARGSDLLARIGGDELAVVLVDSTVEQAKLAAERILVELEQPFDLGQVSVRIGASIGIAAAPADATDPAGLVQCADAAMYRAKAHRTRIEAYEKATDQVRDRLRLADELRTAVAERRLEVHYQPQARPSGEIQGFEALVRWPNPRLGTIGPLEFLPIAEEAGLMHQLTAFVLETAIAQCDSWRAAGRPLSVSVNISSTDLITAGFAGDVALCLQRHSLPPEALVLEITETTILEQFDRCKEVIAQLQDMGVCVSIDDFGAGFTSLAYLANLAVRELKLDRTFISQITHEDARTKTLVRASIHLAHALGLRVVAEGVEDRATFTLLGQLQCDLIQGYFIGRPRPAAHLAFDATATATVPQRVTSAGLDLKLVGSPTS